MSISAITWDVSLCYDDDIVMFNSVCLLVGYMIGLRLFDPVLLKAVPCMYIKSFYYIVCYRKAG